MVHSGQADEFESFYKTFRSGLTKMEGTHKPWLPMFPNFGRYTNLASRSLTRPVDATITQTLT